MKKLHKISNSIIKNILTKGDTTHLASSFDNLVSLKTQSFESSEEAIKDYT